MGNYVWEDVNKDGVEDGNEVGIPNVKVALKDAAGTVVSTAAGARHRHFPSPLLPFFLAAMSGEIAWGRQSARNGEGEGAVGGRVES